MQVRQTCHYAVGLMSRPEYEQPLVRYKPLSRKRINYLVISEFPQLAGVVCMNRDSHLRVRKLSLTPGRYNRRPSTPEFEDEIGKGQISGRPPPLQIFFRY